VIKYDLTDTAFIWDVLNNMFMHFKSRFDFIKRLKEVQFNIAVPPDHRSTTEREREIERRGSHGTRKEAEQKRKIKKEMEESYIKEGEDIWIKSDWVKTETIYENNNLNKDITEYTPSFRRIFPADMNPVILNYYTDAMKDIVEENKLRWKREERERKKKKDKEKQIKIVKRKNLLKKL
jgi:hypothetical protein